MPSAEPSPASDSVFFEFPARSYLEKYYSEVGDENAAFVGAIGDYLAPRLVPTDTVIEVAGGPSLFALMAIAAQRQRPFDHVTFTDIGWKNLREVDAWLRDDPAHFDYQPLLGWLSDHVAAEPDVVRQALRESSWELVRFDWREPPPSAWVHAYDVVSSHFFAESATSDEDELLEFLAKLGRLARPGAVLLMSFMCRSTGYTIGRREYPAFCIDEQNVLAYLERAGLALEDAELRTAPTENPAAMPGYDGMVFVGARIPG